MGDLIGRITAEYPAFDFFQAVSLLEEYFRVKQGMADPIATGRLRFIADTSFTFPPNDIAAVDTGSGFVQLVLSFMGLTGVSSPLPHYFTEYVHANGSTSPAMREFLAIFNNRMYALFFRSWKKYHFMRTFSAAGNDAFCTRIAALAGRDPTAPREPFAMRLSAYTGVFATRPRGASGLQTLLSDFFGNIPLIVRQWMPRWALIPDLPRMGVDTRLGVNAVAGTHRRDYSGKFRIVIGPLAREMYETFLPGSENIALLRRIVLLYLIDPLEFDVEVQLQSTDLVPVVLGENAARLGTTSSLGRSSLKSSVQSIVIE